MIESESLKSILSNHAFFSGMPDEQLETIVECASNRLFKAGEYMLMEGNEAKHFYLIRKGKVYVKVHSAHQKSLTIQTLTNGDALGWSWLIPPHYCRFDARVSEDTIAIAIDGRCLREKCESDPKLGYDLLKRFSSVLAQRLEDTRIQLLDVFGSSRLK